MTTIGAKPTLIPFAFGDGFQPISVISNLGSARPTVSGEDILEACSFEQPWAPILDHDRVSR
jgi:hypothetical protein